VRKMKSIKLTSDMENLGHLASFVSECARDQGMTPERAGELQVALEEAFVNICRYAYADGPGDVEVNFFSEGDNTVIEIIDSGTPFDITVQELPDITADIHERKIGGLGCLLIRKLMDRVVYRREDGKNILRFTGFLQ
jgi:serine/threonine-protein kinase RsbW